VDLRIKCALDLDTTGSCPPVANNFG